MKIKTNKGTAEINSGSQVPSGFPAAVPLPTFLKLSTSLGTTTNSKSGFDLIYNVSGSLTQAVDRYDSAIRSAGFTAKLTGSVTGNIEQVWETSAWTIDVNASPSSGGGQPATLDLIVVPTTPSSSS